MNDHYVAGLKQYEELEYRDNFMFGKTMEDLELCHDVIECLLQRPVCTFDPFGANLPWYTFRERCDESRELVLADGTEKHFFNCSCDSKDLPEEIHSLFEYVMSGRADSPLTKRIDAAVARARKNDIWRLTIKCQA